MEHQPNRPSKSAAVVALLLVIQLFILGMSFNGYDAINILCTAPDIPSARWVGWLHIAYAVLLPVGVISMPLPRLRTWYTVLILLTLPLLAFQPQMLAQGSLHCDAP